MQAVQRLDNLVIDEHFHIDAWTPFQGGLFDEEAKDSSFIYYLDRVTIGPWPPSITSYHGHPIPYPDVKVQYLEKERKFWKVIVTFYRRRYNFDLDIPETVEVTRVRGWQGDNNTIHLLSPLPGEDDLTLDMSQLAESPEEVDFDYFRRFQIAGNATLAELSM